MILPCPSGSGNQGFGVLIFSLAGRAVSKPASLDSGRRVFRPIPVDEIGLYK